MKTAERQFTTISGANGHTIDLPLDRIAEICKEFRVNELAIFGSAARGEMQPGSDIDILVDFDSDARIGIVRFASLSAKLEELLGSRVDLVTKSGLKPWVRPRVLSEAMVVYAK